MIAVVTGASRGVGRGIALALGEAGAKVFLTGRTAEALESAEEEIRQRGGEAAPCVCDHTGDAQVEAVFARRPFDLSATESPKYAGRAVAHLARDPEVLRFSGQVLTAGQLAREYGFTDVDGRQPPTFEMPEGYALD